ncbi:hypothetical protein D5F51_14455 [Yersinia hibernica]|uniref:Uncharacterized protein n=1 Tax=Yersinia hibernica TaxID=2339259 RepID=A0ABX5R240_9GAMM|nr:hypothetical protein D5F51_14455 [Yersinia hibernica]
MYNFHLINLISRLINEFRTDLSGTGGGTRSFTQAGRALQPAGEWKHGLIFLRGDFNIVDNN